MTLKSTCFLCGEHPPLRILGGDTQLQNWAMSLLSILDLTPEEVNVQGHLARASFCSRCQESVCNGEFTLKTITKLQMELERIQNNIKTSLRGHYAALIDSGIPGLDSHCNAYDESIPNIIATIGLKRESSATGEHSIALVLEDEEDEGSPAQSTRDASYERLQKLKARQRPDSASEIQYYSRYGRTVKRCPTFPPDEDQQELDYEPPDSDYEEVEKVKKNPTRRISSPRNYSCTNRDHPNLPSPPPSTHEEIKTLDDQFPVALFQNSEQSCVQVLPRGLQDPPPTEHVLQKIDSPYCSECRKHLKDFPNYKSHVKRRHPLLYKDKVSSGEFQKRKHEPRALSVPNVTSKKSGGNGYRSCPMCSAVLREAYVEIHLRESCKKAENVVKSFMCHMCSYATRRKSNLVIHLQSHSDLRRYTCALCSYTSKTAPALFAHKKSKHSGDGANFSQCTVCGEFIKGGSWILQKHVEAVHENHRPFPCTLCEKKFKTKTHLRYHEKTHGNPNGKKRGLNKERPFFKRAPNKKQKEMESIPNPVSEPHN